MTPDCHSYALFRTSGISQVTYDNHSPLSLPGSESVALKVAEFVVRAFQTANKPPTSNRRWPQNDLQNEESSSYSESESYTHDKGPDYDVNETQSPLTPLRQIVRLFGLQPNQISAVAVNALVFVAQMVSMNTFHISRSVECSDNLRVNSIDQFSDC